MVAQKKKKSEYTVHIQRLTDTQPQTHFVCFQPESFC